MADEATPVDFLPNLPPRTELEQLTAALNAGLISPALFALAKERLLQSTAPPAAAPAEPAPAPPAAAPEPTAGELPPLTSFFTEPVQVVPPLAAPTPTPAPPARPTPSLPARPAPAPSPPAAAPKPSYLFGQEIEVPPVVPAARPAAPENSEPTYVDFLGTSTSAVPVPVPTPPKPAPPAAGRATAVPAGRSALPKVLLAMGILGLLLLLYWQVVGSHPDEQLTSPRLPAASTTAATAAPKATKAKKHRKHSPKPAGSSTFPLHIHHGDRVDSAIRKGISETGYVVFCRK